MILTADTKYGVTYVLAGACVLCVIILIIQWNFMSKSGSMTVSGGDHGASIDGIEAQPGENFVLANMASLVEIVERPLFFEKRRPIEEQSEDADVVITPTIRTKMNAKLMGVYSDGDELVALIMDGKGKYKRRRQGDDIDGWQIKSLDYDRVTVIQGGANEELILRKAKPKVTKQPRKNSKSTKPRANGKRNPPRLPKDLKAKLPTGTLE